MSVFVLNKEFDQSTGLVKSLYGVTNGYPVILSIARFKPLTLSKPQTKFTDLYSKRTKIGSYIKLVMMTSYIKKVNADVLKKEMNLILADEDSQKLLSEIKESAKDSIDIAKKVLFFYKELSRISTSVLTDINAIGDGSLDDTFVTLLDDYCLNLLTKQSAPKSLDDILNYFGWGSLDVQKGTTTAKVAQLVYGLSLYAHGVYSSPKSGPISATGPGTSGDPMKIMQWYPGGAVPDLHVMLPSAENDTSGFFINADKQHLATWPTAMQNKIDWSWDWWSQDMVNIEAIKLLMVADNRLRNLNQAAHSITLQTNILSKTKLFQSSPVHLTNVSGIPTSFWSVEPGMSKICNNPFGYITGINSPNDESLLDNPPYLESINNLLFYSSHTDPLTSDFHPTPFLPLSTPRKPPNVLSTTSVGSRLLLESTQPNGITTQDRSLLEAYLLPPVLADKKAEAGAEFFNYATFFSAISRFQISTSLLYDVSKRLNYNHYYKEPTLGGLDAYNSIQAKIDSTLKGVEEMNRSIIWEAIPLSGQVTSKQANSSNTKLSEMLDPQAKLRAMIVFLFERVAANPNLHVKVSATKQIFSRTIKQALFDALVVYDFAMAMDPDGDMFPTGYEGPRFQPNTPYFEYFLYIINPLSGPYKDCFLLTEDHPLPLPSVDLYVAQGTDQGGPWGQAQTTVVSYEQYLSAVKTMWLDTLGAGSGQYLIEPDGFLVYLRAVITDIMIKHIVLTIVDGFGPSQSVPNEEITEFWWSPVLQGFGKFQNDWEGLFDEEVTVGLQSWGHTGWNIGARFAAKFVKVLAGGTQHPMPDTFMMGGIFGDDGNLFTLIRDRANTKVDYFTPARKIGGTATGFDHSHKNQKTSVGAVDRKYFIWNQFQTHLALYKNMDSTAVVHVKFDGEKLLADGKKLAVDDYRLALFIKTLNLHTFNLVATDIIAPGSSKYTYGDVLEKSSLGTAYNAMYGNHTNGQMTFDLSDDGNPAIIAYEDKKQKYIEALSPITDPIKDCMYQLGASSYLKLIGDELEQIAYRLKPFSKGQSGSENPGKLADEIRDFIEQDIEDPSVLSALINPAQLVLSLDAANAATRTVQYSPLAAPDKKSFSRGFAMEMNVLDELYYHDSTMQRDPIILSCALPYGLELQSLTALDKSVIMVNVTMNCESMPYLTFLKRRYIFSPTLFVRPFGDVDTLPDGTVLGAQDDLTLNDLTHALGVDSPFIFYPVSELSITDWFGPYGAIYDLDSAPGTDANVAVTQPHTSKIVGGRKFYSWKKFRDEVLSDIPQPTDAYVSMKTYIAKAVFRNHLTSHLLMAYTRLLTDIPMNESMFTGDTKVVKQNTDDPTTFQTQGLIGDFDYDEEYISKVKVLLAEYATQVTNTKITFEDLVKASSKFIDLEALLNELESKSPSGQLIPEIVIDLPETPKTLKLSNDIVTFLNLFGSLESGLSSGFRLLDTILEPKAFERIFHIPVSIDDFIIDERTMKITSPELDLHALQDVGILRRQKIQQSGRIVMPLEPGGKKQGDFIRNKKHLFLNTDTTKPIVTFQIDYELVPFNSMWTGLNTPNENFNFPRQSHEEDH